jgi:hypothetical protein
MAASAAASVKSGSSRIVRRRRGQARSRAFDWRRLPTIALLAGGAIAVGWLAVKTTAVDALVRRNPMAAATFSASDPRIATTMAMTEFRQKQGAISPDVAKQAIVSLQRAPLIEEPFFVAGLAALVRGDENAAGPLLEEARRRNPRSRAARLLLLDRRLRAGRVEEAAAEIGAIGRLMPQARSVLVPELARFVKDPKTRMSLAAVLRNDPEMKRDLLEHLASKGTEPDLVLQLAGGNPVVAPGGEHPRWQQLLISSLIERNDFADARALWSRFAGVPIPKEQTVYDGSFQRRPGPPPFNWQFASSAAGVAEPNKANELQVEYYGRAEGEFASQLLMLTPGTYQISFRASGDTPDKGSILSWRVACVPSKSEVGSVPITRLSYAPRLVSGRFVVPAAGCSAQWLRLIGTPAEFPTPQSMTISQVKVAKVPAA